MTDPKKDIKQLVKEMDQTRDDIEKVSNGKTIPTKSSKQTNRHFPTIVDSACILMIFSMAIFYANQATKNEIAILTSGSIGASAGLLVGYTVGRRRGRQ